MNKTKHQDLRDFLKQSSKDNIFKVELTSPLAIRYSHYHKMKLDVKNIINTIDVLLAFDENKNLLDLLPFDSNKKIIIRQNLWYAIVINYGKFFTLKSKDEAPVPHIKLQSNDCYKKATTAQIVMHEHMMEIRNKLVAHGTQNNQEAVIPYFYIHLMPAIQTFEGHLGIEAIGTISFSTKELKILNELVGHLLEYISYKLEQFSDKLEVEINERPIQHWFNEAKDSK